MYYISLIHNYNIYAYCKLATLALQNDVDNYLSEEMIYKRIEEFTKEAKSQGKTIQVVPRNPVVRDNIERDREIKRKIDSER